MKTVTPEGVHPKPRVVFVSGHRFGAEALLGLVHSSEYAEGRFEISALYALHPKHALAIAGYYDLADIAHTHCIPVFRFHSISSPGVLDSICATPHEHLLVIGLSQLVPESILDLPRMFCGKSERHGPAHGCIGMHPTLLPMGRGRAAIPWTILRAIGESGVSAFRLELGADSGNLVDAESFAVGEDETSTTLFEKAAIAHNVLGKRLAKKIADGGVFDIPQDSEKATVWPRRAPSNSWLDFTLDSQVLLRQIRACQSPYPVAFFVLVDQIIQVLEAEESRSHCSNQPPGTVTHVDGILTIRTADSSIQITKYCVQVGSPMLSTAQLNGNRAIQTLDEYD